ncbi:hypothetical protein SZN_14251 [Streptomyces zinciresistens K42]|uniref:Asp23/Gls24 family envelope stress response protein n=1 Tax=Streptomyces zinciresistens K42 TaxID=700597 RepID=G2GBH6_9ACTN|nr:Asp23/Gls24 family envelope stress response protein [Streptomyces zinciresistens]EGX59092.1 hypothetical protein SZN_14251 [Streptomyces zinciresistens K42]
MSADAASPAAAAPVAAGERGSLRIADRVVAKIASQAASEALGGPAPGAARPSADVVVRPQAAGTARTEAPPAGAAWVRIHLELGYPTDVGARCAAVRRQVVERVGALVGMQVPEVAVYVERLHPAPGSGAARRRTR